MLKLSKNIKFIVSDFDGVFTDGGIYISEKNEIQKKMNFKDLMGVSILLKNNYSFAIISGEKSNILNYFKEKFGIVELHGGIRQKGIVLSSLMEKYGMNADEVLYIGDDINDIAAFDCVNYKIAPSNANPIIKVMPDVQVTKAKGGNGAFREMVDCLMTYL